MRVITREIRGIPFFLLREYLQELGGTPVDENRIQGEGWKVQLEKMEPFRLGSLSVGQVRVMMELEDHVEKDFLARFALKTLRAGA